VNPFDYVVLLGTMLGIAGYGIWRTRNNRDLKTYLKGAGNTPWIVIGLSVMATQASAITFLSTPGQGYEDGLGFVQNYFGAPFALIIIAAVFLPIFRRLNVYTAYEYLGTRFDSKTRLLGTALFLFQRGIGAGITIYAPAIVLSTVFNWPLNLTIICSGLLVIVYTVIGGSEAVNITQKYQIGVIFIGMITAFFVMLAKLPAGLTLGDAMTVAGGFHKLQAVDFSIDPSKRYTFWSGIIGGMFLALSYFGTDQSQVQRYLSGSSLRESRLGLMFNAVCKIPMQFFILMLGALMFVSYQFEKPPVFFNQKAWAIANEHDKTNRLPAIEDQFTDAYNRKQELIKRWLDAKHSGDADAEAKARSEAVAAHQRSEGVRNEAKDAVVQLNPGTQRNDGDFVFITFIVQHLPHGLIGLLVAVFFAAAFSSKAGELNALGSTTVVDLYRHVIEPNASDQHYVIAGKLFTVLWGLVALGFALFAHLSENLIQAGNIVGSVFYGVPLALFLVAFFLKWIGGTAVFFAGIVTQALVIVFYFTLPIGYLWYNLIGCAICVTLALVLQLVLPTPREPRGFPVIMDTPKPDSSNP
jgi:solute:Na+ symporter, SSS family